jgi:hypothetical protein
MKKENQELIEDNYVSNGLDKNCQHISQSYSHFHGHNECDECGGLIRCKK